MNSVHLGAIDLNLLPALDALLSERHVTRAAARTGITQSAMSHALARLRERTGDALLTRTPGGYVLTERAETMRAPLARALGEVTQLFVRPTFDPRTEKRTFRIATSDYVELILLPPLMERLAREAPHVDLHVMSRTHSFAGALAEGHIDLAIAPRAAADDAPGLMAKALWSDHFQCVVRRGHPLAANGKTRIPLSKYTKAAHALIAPSETRGSFTDDALARLGLSRRVALRVPHFLLAPHVIAHSDLVLTLASGVTNVMRPLLDLVALAPPRELVLPEFTVSAMWHVRTHDDPANRWLRELIGAVSRPRAPAPRTRPVAGRRRRPSTDGA